MWVKDEEACGAWGGNKVRKLEHLLYELKTNEVETIVAWGAATSNWVAACAWHGVANGFEVRAALGGRVPGDYRSLYESLGTHMTVLPRIEMSPAAAALALAGAGRKARLVPVGGSGGVGDLGAVRTGAEIASAIAAGELPTPSQVFVAAGSCGTVAGIAMGSGASATAVKVADWPYASRTMLDRRVKTLRRNLESRGIAAPTVDITLEKDFLGRGYGRPTAASRAAIAQAKTDGLELDGTYAAKAFAALIDTARRGSGPYLFVHTSPGPPPSRAGNG